MPRYEHKKIASKGSRTALYREMHQLVSDGWTVVSNQGPIIELKRAIKPPRKSSVKKPSTKKAESTES